MSIASPKYANSMFVSVDDGPLEQTNFCEHCGAHLRYDRRNPVDPQGVWVHDYNAPWNGQIVCDPQKAREAAGPWL